MYQYQEPYRYENYADYLNPLNIEERNKKEAKTKKIENPKVIEKRNNALIGAAIGAGMLGMGGAKMVGGPAGALLKFAWDNKMRTAKLAGGAALGTGIAGAMTQ